MQAWLMRFYYTLLWVLLLPAALLRLWIRGLNEPGYRQHMAERLGFYRQKPTRPVIWLHAVSLGETRAAEPLIRALMAQYPQYQWLLTHMTATGRAASEQLFGNTLLRAWLPYDLPWLMRGFMRHYQPIMGLLMETEVWPNMLYVAQRQGVPMMLINGRFSEKSLRLTRRLKTLALPAYGRFTKVLAQTEADAHRLKQVGATAVMVTGNLKFDMTLATPLLSLGAAWKTGLQGRPVFLCASTREGEEALILKAWQAAHPPVDYLLVIVPRHPQRFNEVDNLIRSQGLQVVRRSAWQGGLCHAHVLLGDSVGEMPAYYALADVAYIGGSLLPLGGQNLIEACAAGCPVLLGPHTFNFAQASQDAVAAGAAKRVRHASELVDAALTLLVQPVQRQQMGSSGLAFIAKNRGALDRTIAAVAELL